MPMLENPRPSLNILVKNGRSNGERERWGGRREKDMGFSTVQLSLPAQANSQ